VTRSANKAKAMALMCRMLANCTRGLNLASAREVYLRAIRPLITYAAPVWYKGVNQATLIKKLQVAQNAGVRWCLGAFHTSPIDEMHHLASIPQSSMYSTSFARMPPPASALSALGTASARDAAITPSAGTPS
jgi:hypothetical protein